MAHSLEDLPRPPRTVPISLRLALRLGGVGGVLGWIFALCGMTAVTLFIAFGNFGAALALRTTTLVEADGVALGWARTNTHVNDEPVLANGAVFRVGDRDYECRSYAVGAGLAQGDRVRVEYDPADPTVCRIQGMTVSALPAWVFFIIGPFVLIGLGFAAWRWRRGGALTRLLRDGKLAWGVCVAKAPTNVHINNRQQWAYTFRFEDEVGRAHEAVGRTVDTHALEDEAREAILYDPSRPSEAMVADAEGRWVRVDARGQWRAPGARVIGVLIAPTLTVALLIISVWAF